MSFKNLIKVFLVFASFVIFIPHLFVPVITSNTTSFYVEEKTTYQAMSSSKFIWPIPGYTKISSPFGKRNSPTSGASSYHQGIDIPAPPGTNLVAPCSAIVNYIGFQGSGGYTISLKANNLEFIYHHVSPDYIISKGEQVSSGQLIGYVGPKNVYGVKNNKYKDSKR